jgi:hypothetical protein
MTKRWFRCVCECTIAAGRLLCLTRWSDENVDYFRATKSRVWRNRSILVTHKGCPCFFITLLQDIETCCFKTYGQI